MAEIIIYMIFGIFIFVLGGNFALGIKYRYTDIDENVDEEKQYKIHTKEEYPQEEYAEDIFSEMQDNNYYEDKIKVFDDVEKVKPIPPSTTKSELFDYTPSLYDESNTDVEIITDAMERELYKRATLGGV